MPKRVRIIKPKVTILTHGVGQRPKKKCIPLVVKFNSSEKKKDIAEQNLLLDDSNENQSMDEQCAGSGSVYRRNQELEKEMWDGIRTRLVDLKLSLENPISNVCGRCGVYCD